MTLVTQNDSSAILRSSSHSAAFIPSPSAILDQDSGRRGVGNTVSSCHEGEADIFKYAVIGTHASMTTIPKAFIFSIQSSICARKAAGRSGHWFSPLSEKLISTTVERATPLFG